MLIDRTIAEGFKKRSYTEQMECLDQIRLIYPIVFNAAFYPDIDPESHAFGIYGDLMVSMADIALLYQFHDELSDDEKIIAKEVNDLAMEMSNYSGSLIEVYKRKQKSQKLLDRILAEGPSSPEDLVPTWGEENND